MPPRRLPFREVQRKLLAGGFRPVGQKGSHVKLGKQMPEGYVTVIVPRHNEIAAGTLRSILRQSRLTWEEFERL